MAAARIRICLWTLDDFEANALALRSIGQLLLDVTLIHICQLHLLAGILNCLSALSNLVTALLVRRRDVQREHVNQRIDGHMALRTVLACGPVEAGEGPSGRCQLQRSAMENQG